MGELLVSDMSRRGMIDGRALRLPTITVRPGKPNKAASSFASGIIREPLAGVDAVCPVAPATRMWVQSPASDRNLLIGHDAPASAFGLTAASACRAFRSQWVIWWRRCAAWPERGCGRVSWQLDPRLTGWVSSWPQAFVADRGRALGMTADDDLTISCAPTWLLLPRAGGNGLKGWRTVMSRWNGDKGENQRLGRGMADPR